MGAKLKTFVTSDGLTEYIVATTSRPKALDAWGVSQDLFKSGQARETDDKALVKAAAARPGEVLNRPASGKAPRLPKLPRPAAKPAGPSPAQRRRLADLERKLQAADARFEEARDSLNLERKALDAREERLSAGHDKERAALEERLNEARRALGSG
jgi:hypothetical protein